jgi:uncharacterized protein YbaR (Trm112 family)
MHDSPRPVTTANEGQDAWLSALACPRCKGPLARSDSTLRCVACDERYPREDGVWSLLTSDARRARSARDGGRDGLIARSGVARALDGIREKLASEPAVDDALLGELLDAALPRSGLVVDLGDDGFGARLGSGLDRLRVDPFAGAGAHAVRGVATELPVRDRAAQAALCVGGFDRLGDGSLALLEVSRVLAPGGSLALVLDVVPASVAHARGSSSRVERVLGAWRASRALGAQGARALVADALLGDRASGPQYTRTQALALVGVRFHVESVRARAGAVATTLYVHARKRTQRRLHVL